jgi:hypothetical protein
LLVDFGLQNPYNAANYDRSDVRSSYDWDGFHRLDDDDGHAWLLSKGSPDCGTTSEVEI